MNKKLERTLKDLVLVLLEGRTNVNPYTIPEVKAALNLLYGNWQDAPGPEALRKELHPKE